MVSFVEEVLEKKFYDQTLVLFAYLFPIDLIIPPYCIQTDSEN
ncbi:MAG TPA: hypothetical protein VLM20_08750 [Methylophilaceae bacterium]|nr:hypothetical protein [Methylophilaceae bacterium]